MGGRALTYPIAALIVPLGWWLWGNHKSRHYPYALDLYDSIDGWDDFNHFLNWGLLTAAFGQLLLRYALGRVNPPRSRSVSVR